MLRQLQNVFTTTPAPDSRRRKSRAAHPRLQSYTDSGMYCVYDLLNTQTSPFTVGPARRAVGGSTRLLRGRLQLRTAWTLPPWIELEPVRPWAATAVLPWRAFPMQSRAFWACMERVDLTLHPGARRYLETSGGSTPMLRQRMARRTSSSSILHPHLDTTSSLPPGVRADVARSCRSSQRTWGRASCVSGT